MIGTVVKIDIPSMGMSTAKEFPFEAIPTEFLDGVQTGIGLYANAALDHPHIHIEIDINPPEDSPYGPITVISKS